MSQQPSVASFFGKRKKVFNDDIYRSKLLKTSDNSVPTFVPVNEECCESKPKEPTFRKGQTAKTGNDVVKISEISGSSAIQNKEKPTTQLSIREALKHIKKPLPPSYSSPVKFELLGSLSPAKKSNRKALNTNNEGDDSLQATSNEGILKDKVSKPTAKNPSVKNLDFGGAKDSPTDDIIKSAEQLVSKIKETQKKLTTEKTPKKELSLREIKDKLKRSSKLNELKKSISKINEHAEELIELEKKKLVGAQPKLSKFKTIELEVPVSPKKNSLYSPVKPSSPSKPAFERFAALTDVSPLPLPFGYKKLYELFQAVDTVCAMMINRGEIITFNKLKPAVEEMTRKNFTTRHLGQMATVLPEAFSFHQEKLRNFGSTSKADKYELVITPIIPNNQGNSFDKIQVKEDEVFRRADRSIMTPNVTKARKKSFFKSLLEKTKDYHEEFLKTLEPPITIDRNDLKRWHPNFMVDLVPDVNPQELPQPPNSDKPATAKEILERAKDFLSSNARLQKALEAAAGSSTESPDLKPKVSLEIKQKVDARLGDPLKGISKSLLEKVRARQAAKALDTMRMTPEQEKESLMYARLPDIARIVRTIFINEQKAVLLLEIVLEKVQFSYNRNLDLGEVGAHVRLLCEKLPEWLSIVHIRYTDYLKMDRSIDVSSVMAKLKKIVEDRKQDTKIF